MINSYGYAAHSAGEALKPFNFTRREVGPKDVLIDILYSGICHTDIHHARNDWKRGVYPMVPGHEIVGVVKAIGRDVKNFKIGDTVGVGCFVDSCRECDECKDDQEQFCETKALTYGSQDSKTGGVTYGGYSNNIVVDEHFVVAIPENLDPASAAPLLCAGITTYSPLRHWKIKAGDKVGIVGLGGLGHMAVKIAKAMGAEVTVLTRSQNKTEDAKRLGADHVILSTDPKALATHTKYFDLILNTVSASHDLDIYIELLKRDGTIVFVGLPSDQHPSPTIQNLIFSRRSISGSLVGGLKETQEMLEFCGKHNITADIEVIDIKNINEAFERVLKSDVKYRFVVDMKSLSQA